MVNWNFVTPWLSKLSDNPDVALEFNNLKTYLARIDSGDLPLFNPHLQNSTIDTLTATNSNLGTLIANLAAGGFKLTGLGAGTTAGDSVRFEQNKIIQIVTTTTNSQTSTTSTSYVGVTNMSLAITPTSASNKILILLSGSIAGTSNAGASYGTVKRGSTDLAVSATLGFFTATPVSAVNFEDMVGLNFIDSPATTSSTTYQVFIRTNNAGNTAWWNLSLETSSLTLIEVAP